MVLLLVIDEWQLNPELVRGILAAIAARLSRSAVTIVPIVVGLQRWDRPTALMMFSQQTVIQETRLVALHYTQLLPAFPNLVHLLSDPGALHWTVSMMLQLAEGSSFATAELLQRLETLAANQSPGQATLCIPLAAIPSIFGYVASRNTHRSLKIVFDCIAGPAEAKGLASADAALLAETLKARIEALATLALSALTCTGTLKVNGTATLADLVAEGLCEIYQGRVQVNFFLVHPIVSFLSHSREGYYLTSDALAPAFDSRSFEKHALSLMMARINAAFLICQGNDVPLQTLFEGLLLSTDLGEKSVRLRALTEPFADTTTLQFPMSKRAADAAGLFANESFAMLTGGGAGAKAPYAAAVIKSGNLVILLQARGWEPPLGVDCLPTPNGLCEALCTPRGILLEWEQCGMDCTDAKEEEKNDKAHLAQSMLQAWRTAGCEVVFVYFTNKPVRGWEVPAQRASLLPPNTALCCNEVYKRVAGCAAPIYDFCNYFERIPLDTSI
eukprot:TRINITY_DN5969_c0_g1_i2.p1 TRINITY_DN5969_c0_g1~~TRINITY_DN5969_c0_g1_i2.p1  ORF type:complete len:501 (-),score=75.12 TRINITY_DN5969_c0_g1_i2:353-1855(-)